MVVWTPKAKLKLATFDDIKRVTVPFLYKYRKTDRMDFLRQIILDHTLYIPKPSEFEDPEEGRPRFVARSFEALVALLSAKSGKASPLLTDYGVVNTPEDTARSLAQIGYDRALAMCEKSFHREVSTQRIYSLGQTPANRHLWQRYGGNHTGCCLEFRNAGIFAENSFHVVYESVELDITDPRWIDHGFAFYFYKARRWQNEREVRVVGRRNPTPLVSIEPSMLARIILGKDIAPDHAATLREWAEQRTPQVPVVRARALPDGRVVVD